MHKYRSKCRWNILLFIDGDIKEIRPGEVFEYDGIIESRFVIQQQQSEIQNSVKRGRPKKKPVSSNIFLKEPDGASSTES
jgi:hypothetical protein